MGTCVMRILYAAAAASLALAAAGIAGAGTAEAARAAPQSLGSPAYDANWTGYTAGGGRWFRFVSTTLTVPPSTVNSVWSGDATIMLNHDKPTGLPNAQITVYSGGGPQSVIVGTSPGSGETLNLSPNVGDQLAVSIYYDKNGHDYFTVADLTQGITRTVRATVGSVVYDKAWLAGIAGDSQVPQADTRSWEFTSSRVTTYTGAHGTILGPWTTNELIATSTGTSTGRVVASPSGLWNGGANFGVWLRAIPVTYTTGFAGYTDSVGPFRFVATTMTVPSAQAPTGNGGMVLVSLGHNGGPTPRPYADITVVPGGGAGSIGYDSNAARGTFTVNPAPGDQVRASIFYDQKGHYSFTVTDATQGTSQTVTVAAPYAGSMPLNSAQVLGMFDNSKVVPPPSDTQVWQFTDSNVTTYGGDHGSILGPWATSWWIDTTDGTQAGAVVADATVLSNGGQDFGVWLRHH